VNTTEAVATGPTRARSTIRSRNKWTSVNPPTGWNSIGDSASLILPDGSFMLADWLLLWTGQQVLGTVSGTNRDLGDSYDHLDVQQGSVELSLHGPKRA